MGEWRHGRRRYRRHRAKKQRFLKWNRIRMLVTGPSILVDQLFLLKEQFGGLVGRKLLERRDRRPERQFVDASAEPACDNFANRQRCGIRLSIALRTYLVVHTVQSVPATPPAVSPHGKPCSATESRSDVNLRFAPCLIQQCVRLRLMLSCSQ